MLIPLYAAAEYTDHAAQLAAEFNLEYPAQTKSAPYYLQLTQAGLILQDKRSNAPGKGLLIDFTAGKNQFRYQHGNRQQPLARALGLKHNRCPSVIDATAGLGRDAFVLAALGCRITLLERSNVLAAMLTVAWQRAAAQPELTATMQRMQIIHADSRNYLIKLTEKSAPTAIYLDPMYPKRKKSALVKKEMRYIRDLVGEDDDAAELLQLAEKIATERVVVKRPKIALPLTEQKPDTQIHSPNTRYDLYLRKSSNPNG